MTDPENPTEPLDPDHGLVDPAPAVEEEPVDPEEDPPSFGGLSPVLLGWIVGGLLLVLLAGKAWAIWYVVHSGEATEKDDWAQILDQIGGLDAVVTAIVGGILGIKIQGLQTKKAHAKAKKNHEVAQHHKHAAEANRDAARTNRAKAHQRGVAILDVAHELENAVPRRDLRKERRLNLLQTAVPREVADVLALDATGNHRVTERLLDQVQPQFEEVDEASDRVDESELASRLRSAL